MCKFCKCFHLLGREIRLVNETISLDSIVLHPVTFRNSVCQLSRDVGRAGGKELKKIQNEDVVLSKFCAEMFCPQRHIVFMRDSLSRTKCNYVGEIHFETLQYTYSIHEPSVCLMIIAMHFANISKKCSLYHNLFVFTTYFKGVM